MHIEPDPRSTRIVAVAVVVTLAAAAFAGAQSPDPMHLFTLYGTNLGDHYGLGGGGLGDVDGDGHPDLLCGNAYDDTKGPDHGSVDVRSGRTGKILYTVQGLVPSGVFGWCASAIGDISSDGIDDFIVGARFANYARVYSGKDGSVLYTVQPDAATDRIGLSVDGAGDVNKDGVPDFIVGAPEDQPGGTTIGFARIFSGADYSVLWTFRGTQFGDKYGLYVSRAGDIDKDGYDDVAIGATQPQLGPGFVEFRSGRTGAIIRTVYGDNWDDQFGWYVNEAGDVDKDTYPDVIVGAPRDDDNGPESGTAKVISGKDGTFLHTWSGDSAGDDFGYAVGPAGDYDEDGYDDVIVGGVQITSRLPGYARVFSGKDGTLLHQYGGPNVYSLAGWIVRTVGDVNKDGVLDLMIGVPHDNTRGRYVGMIRIESSKPMPLTTDTHTLSVNTAAVQTLYIDAGPPHANKAYVLAGSLTGTSPGFTVGNVTVPLNIDAYFYTSIFANNTPPLGNNVGTLSAQGYATATFTVLPALFGGLVGVSIDHAYVVVGQGGLDFASNPASLLFVP